MIKSFPFLLLFITSGIFISGITCKLLPEHTGNHLIRERRGKFHSQPFAGNERNRGAAKLKEK